MTGDLHNNIDDLFKSGLEGKEEAPQEKVWSTIEQELDKNSAISIRKKYIRMKRASAILLILLLGVSIYAIRNNFINSRGNEAGQQQSSPANSGKGQPSTEQPVKDNNSDNAGEQGKSSTLPSSEQNSEKTIVYDESGKTVQKNESVKKSDSKSDALAESKTDALVINPTGKEKDNSFATRSRHQRPPGTVQSTPGENPPLSPASSEKNKGKGRKNVAAVPSAAENNNLASISNTEPSPAWELSMIEPRSSRELPGTDTKISGENALSAAIKSTPINNSSIPVKNRKNNLPNLSRFSVTPMASVNLMSNHIVHNSAHPGTLGNHKEDIERTEEEKLSYTFGLLFDLKIAKRMTFQTGIGYMEKTTFIDPKEISAVKAPDGKIKYQFDCSAGRYYLNPKYGTWPRVGDSAYTMASANKLNYITVPLALTYHFGKNKWSFYAMAGGDANFLLGQDLTTGLNGASYYGKKSTTPVGLNNVYVNGILGGGVNYSLNRWLGLTLSPSYKFALNPINKDMPFKAYPRSLSLSGGVRISF